MYKNYHFYHYFPKIRKKKALQGQKKYKKAYTKSGWSKKSTKSTWKHCVRALPLHRTRKSYSLHNEWLVDEVERFLQVCSNCMMPCFWLDRNGNTKFFNTTKDTKGVFERKIHPVCKQIKRTFRTRPWSPTSGLSFGSSTLQAPDEKTKTQFHPTCNTQTAQFVPASVHSCDARTIVFGNVLVSVVLPCCWLYPPTIEVEKEIHQNTNKRSTTTNRIQ